MSTNKDYNLHNIKTEKGKDFSFFLINSAIILCGLVQLKKYGCQGSSGFPLYNFL